MKQYIIYLSIYHSLESLMNRVIFFFLLCILCIQFASNNPIPSTTPSPFTLFSNMSSNSSTVIPTLLTTNYTSLPLLLSPSPSFPLLLLPTSSISLNISICLYNYWWNSFITNYVPFSIYKKSFSIYYNSCLLFLMCCFYLLTIYCTVNF